MEAHDHQRTEHKTFSKPDEVRQFPHGRAELLNVGTGQVGRLVLQPGWRWSNDVKPIRQDVELPGPALPVPPDGEARDHWFGAANYAKP